MNGGARLCILALLVQTLSAGFIDMDTPIEKRTCTSLIDGSVYDLVMSDEFNVPNRTFTDGHDPVWTALDKSDDDSSSAGGGSLHFYNSSWVTTTEEGMLKIRASTAKTEWDRFDHVKQEWKSEKTNFKSGMLQSWEKFCFTGGIVEVDVIFPGDPSIGGMWPAVWMLGNIGRATYEASTNNIWPWSFDKCDRDIQQAQTISACNEQNHFGMHAFQGRGATEVDIIEVMTGDSSGALPDTDPPISIPYADFTLQTAPGIKKNRPQSGSAPVRKSKVVNGISQNIAQVWYENLILKGNTSLNPFFYGTYLGETKPNEPVTRTKVQAFQADAIGALHQLTPAHFNTTHTFRLEWQPGPGGRLDWFTKSHKEHNKNGTFSKEGDGLGKDWVHAFSIKDTSLNDLMGSQIPNEPSSLIMNLAISSTWGFPYDVPAYCEKCYDCEDPSCACAFYPGFCSQMKNDGVAMYVDSIRVFQSYDSSAHVGNNHTLGCDPPEYPTREWIEGHQYRYMRNPPFSNEDKKPLRPVQRGGGKCTSDADCGYNVVRENFTSAFADIEESMERKLEEEEEVKGRGICVKRQEMGHMFFSSQGARVCKCNPGFTGPHCMAQAHFDSWPSAKEIRLRRSPFDSISHLQPTPFMMVMVLVLAICMVVALVVQVEKRKETTRAYGSSDDATPKLAQSLFKATGNSHLLITGRSV